MLSQALLPPFCPHPKRHSTSWVSAEGMQNPQGGTASMWGGDTGRWAKGRQRGGAPNHPLPQQGRTLKTFTPQAEWERGKDLGENGQIPGEVVSQWEALSLPLPLPPTRY